MYFRVKVWAIEKGHSLVDSFSGILESYGKSEASGPTADSSATYLIWPCCNTLERRTYHV